MDKKMMFTIFRFILHLPLSTRNMKVKLFNVLSLVTVVVVMGMIKLWTI